MTNSSSSSPLSVGTWLDSIKGTYSGNFEEAITGYDCKDMDKGEVATCDDFADMLDDSKFLALMDYDLDADGKVKAPMKKKLLASFGMLKE